MALNFQNQEIIRGRADSDSIGYHANALVNRGYVLEQVAGIHEAAGGDISNTIHTLMDIDSDAIERINALGRSVHDLSLEQKTEVLGNRVTFNDGLRNAKRIRWTGRDAWIVPAIGDSDDYKSWIADNRHRVNTGTDGAAHIDVHASILAADGSVTGTETIRNTAVNVIDSDNDSGAAPGAIHLQGLLDTGFGTVFNWTTSDHFTNSDSESGSFGTETTEMYVSFTFPYGQVYLRGVDADNWLDGRFLLSTGGSVQLVDFDNQVNTLITQNDANDSDARVAGDSDTLAAAERYTDLRFDEYGSWSGYYIYEYDYFKGDITFRTATDGPVHQNQGWTQVGQLVVSEYSFSTKALADNSILNGTPGNIDNTEHLKYLQVGTKVELERVSGNTIGTKIEAVVTNKHAIEHHPDRNYSGDSEDRYRFDINLLSYPSGDTNISVSDVWSVNFYNGTDNAVSVDNVTGLRAYLGERDSDLNSRILSIELEEEDNRKYFERRLQVDEDEIAHIPFKGVSSHAYKINTETPSWFDSEEIRIHFSGNIDLPFVYRAWAADSQGVGPFNSQHVVIDLENPADRTDTLTLTAVHASVPNAADQSDSFINIIGGDTLAITPLNGSEANRTNSGILKNNVDFTGDSEDLTNYTVTNVAIQFYGADGQLDATTHITLPQPTTRFIVTDADRTNKVFRTDTDGDAVLANINDLIDPRAEAIADANDSDILHNLLSVLSTRNENFNGYYTSIDEAGHAGDNDHELRGHLGFYYGNGNRLGNNAPFSDVHNIRINRFAYPDSDLLIADIRHADFLFNTANKDLQFNLDHLDLLAEHGGGGKIRVRNTVTGDGTDTDHVHGTDIVFNVLSVVKHVDPSNNDSDAEFYVIDVDISEGGSTRYNPSGSDFTTGWYVAFEPDIELIEIGNVVGLDSDFIGRTVTKTYIRDKIDIDSDYIGTVVTDTYISNIVDSDYVNSITNATDNDSFTNRINSIIGTGYLTDSEFNFGFNPPLIEDTFSATYTYNASDVLQSIAYSKLAKAGVTANFFKEFTYYSGGDDDGRVQAISWYRGTSNSGTQEVRRNFDYGVVNTNRLLVAVRDSETW